MGMLVPICLSICSSGMSMSPESPPGMPLLAGMLSSCIAGKERGPDSWGHSIVLGQPRSNRGGKTPLRFSFL
eukprot:747840-Pelagomonas_calceolata.AAC.1